MVFSKIVKKYFFNYFSKIYFLTWFKRRMVPYKMLLKIIETPIFFFKFAFSFFFFKSTNEKKYLKFSVISHDRSGSELDVCHSIVLCVLFRCGYCKIELWTIPSVGSCYNHVLLGQRPVGISASVKICLLLYTYLPM